MGAGSHWVSHKNKGSIIPLISPLLTVFTILDKKNTKYKLWH